LKNRGEFAVTDNVFAVLSKSSYVNNNIYNNIIIIIIRPPLRTPELVSSGSEADTRGQHPRGR